MFGSNEFRSMCIFTSQLLQAHLICKLLLREFSIPQRKTLRVSCCHRISHGEKLYKLLPERQGLSFFANM